MQSGRISTGASSPPRRSDTVTAAPIVAEGGRAPACRASSDSDGAPQRRPSIDSSTASSGLAISSGSAVSSQCASSFAATDRLERDRGVAEAAAASRRPRRRGTAGRARAAWRGRPRSRRCRARAGPAARGPGRWRRAHRADHDEEQHQRQRVGAAARGEPQVAAEHGEEGAHCGTAEGQGRGDAVDIVMRCGNDGAAARSRPATSRATSASPSAIERGGGLVEQPDLAVGDEQAGERQPLGLAGAEIAGVEAVEAAEPDKLERCGRGEAGAAIGGGPEAQVFERA